MVDEKLMEILYANVGKERYAKGSKLQTFITNVK
jgi:hypothetical protein